MEIETHPKRSMILHLSFKELAIHHLVWMVGGVLIALYVFPADWSVGMKVAWGVLGGLGSAFTVLFNRVLML